MSGPRITEQSADLEAWAKNIRRLRLENEWTQTELARRSESTPSNIARIEAGKYPPDMKLLLRLRDLFHTTLDELMVEQKPESPREKQLNQFIARLRHLSDEQFSMFMQGMSPMVSMIQSNELAMNPPTMHPHAGPSHSPTRRDDRIFPSDPKTRTK